MKIRNITFFFCLIIFFSCKKKEEPIGPDNNPFRAVFAEKFDDETDWKYHLMEFDSNGSAIGYINPNFFFRNGTAELIATQNTNCARKALTKSLSNSQEIIDIIESDTLFVSLQLTELEYTALGWSSIIIALDNHLMRFSMKQITKPTNYSFKIANWQLYDLVLSGDTSASMILDYSNNPDELGTNQIIIRADACGADLGAEAKMVIDELSIVEQIAPIGN